MNTIDEKIRELSQQDGKMFNKVLMDNLYDRCWCRSHKINYVHLDFELAREKTYKEMVKYDLIKEQNKGQFGRC